MPETIKIEHAPSSFLQYLTSPWPFALWGLDFLEPFPTSNGQRKSIPVACDYFTKWVEAETVSNVTERNVQSFIYNNILVRFEVPHSLIMDNGWQFNCKGVKNF